MSLEYTTKTRFVHEIPELIRARDFEELVEKGKESLKEKGINPSSLKFENCIGIMLEDTSFVPFDEELYEMAKVRLELEEEKSFLKIGTKEIPTKNILYAEVPYMMKLREVLKYLPENFISNISPELAENLDTELPVRRRVEDIMFESQNVDLDSIDAKRISERIGKAEPMMFYEKKVYKYLGGEIRDGPHLRTKEKQILGKKKEIDEKTLKTFGTESDNLFFREPGSLPLEVLFPYELFSGDSAVGLEVEGVFDFDYVNRNYV